jgi:hypothetical protein
MLAVTGTATALDPEKRISQYVFDVWQTRDGLPINEIFSIAQTPDGYLWLATPEGLVRFDGARFMVFGRTDRRSPSTLTRQLLVTARADSGWGQIMDSLSGAMAWSPFSPPGKASWTTTCGASMKTGRGCSGSALPAD